MRPDCRDFDLALLEAAERPSEVAVVPTAVVRHGSVPAAVGQARDYFGGLGLTAVHVPLHRRSDASDAAVVGALRGARLTYLLGGDPGYLLQTLRETPAWDAMRAALGEGGALAGSSAGAMVLAGSVLFRSRDPRPQARHGREALGLLPDTVVIPHLNTFGAGWLPSARREVPGADLLGLDEATGLVFAGGWTAHGPGEVRLWPGGADPPVVAREGQSLDWRAPVVG
jgi:cyanophycinase-like exopeptidase